MSSNKAVPVLLIGAALAIGLVLFFFLRSPDGGGRDGAFSRLTAESESETAEPAPRTLDAPRPADADTEDTAGTREEVATEEQSTRTRDGEDVRWLAGRVVHPQGTPPDEKTLVLSLASFRDRQGLYNQGGPALAAWDGRAEDGLLDWTTAEPNGTFRIALPPGDGPAHLAVSGRYLFSAASTSVPPGADQVVLPAELGAWVVGRLVAPLGLVLEDEDLSGIEVELVPDISGAFDAFGIQNLAIRQTVESAADGSFEFRAVSPAYTTGFMVRPERFAAARHLGIDVEGGQHREIDVPLSKGTTLLGSVLDESGAGVEGAKVEASFRGALGQAMRVLRETETDERGQYELTAVTVDDIELTGTHDGFVKASINLDQMDLVEDGRVLGIDLLLRKGASIAGRVQFPDGSPAAGAELRAMPDLTNYNPMGGANFDFSNRARTTADDEGRFLIEGLPKQKVDVRAKKEVEKGERAGAWRAVVRAVGPDSDPIEITLERTASLLGEVVDTAGNPVTDFGAIVTLAGTGGMFGLGAERRGEGFEDSEDGHFEIEGLSPGTYMLQIRAEGYGTSEEQEVAVPQPEGTRARVVLEAAAGVAGRVVDTAGQPVGGARVTLEFDLAARMASMQTGGAPTAYTDTEGNFELLDLDPGPIQLSASLQGFAASAAHPVEVVSGEVARDVTLQLRLGGKLTGEVLTPEGEPWAGRMVIAQRMPDFGAQRMMQSDDSGRFEAEHLEPGDWQVVATPNFMQGEGGDGTGEDGGMSELFENMLMDVAKIIDGEVTHVLLGAPPSDPVKVRGVVTHDGEPVAGAMVSFVPEGGDGLSSMRILVTDAQGRYEEDLDHPGPYLVTAQVVASMGEQHSVEYLEEIADEEEVRLDIELPLGRISGRIVDEEGEPVPGARVTLHTEHGMAFGSFLGGQYAEITAGDDGKYDLEYLKPGTYSVGVGGTPMGGILGGESKGGRVVEGGLSISEGEHLDDVDFVLASPGELVGKVTDENGQPVPQATVFVRDSNGRLVERISFVVTDSSGKFSYKGLAEGEYSVVAKEGERVSADSASVRVPAGGRAEANVALEQGTVLLVTVDGVENLRGARVRVTGPGDVEYTGMFSLSELMEASRDFSSQVTRVGPLPSGEYTAYVTLPDGRTTKKPVTVRGTGERKLKVRFR